MWFQEYGRVKYLGEGMSLTEKLSSLISTYMSRPGHIAETQTESEFIMSALRAGISANMITRRKILSDVSNILNCNSEDLEFLFIDFSVPVSSKKHYDILVPDYRSSALYVAE